MMYLRFKDKMKTFNEEDYPSSLKMEAYFKHVASIG